MRKGEMVAPRRQAVRFAQKERHHFTFVLAVAVAAVSTFARADNLSTSADDLALTDYVTGLGEITDFAFLPDGRVVITEKEGALKVRRPDGTVVVAAQFAVDASSEKGLLGVAVDPDFARTRRLFLYYSRADGTDLDRHRVVSARLGTDDKLDRASEKVLIDHLRGPRNHDGGGLAIGPDGKLYVGVGDTGCNSNRPPDPPYAPTNYFATCLSNANGKILRITLDGAVPDDNPLARVAQATACGDHCGDATGAKLAPPRREIWAWGFRNPWRFWFDPRTGKLWVGDVGEITWEEIDVVERGRHYGWPWREGRHGWPQSRCRSISPGAGDCVDPVYECHHGTGPDGDCKSITAGAIVDSCRWPERWRGRYLFADNANARLFALRVTPARDSIVPHSREDLGRFTDGIPVSIHLGPDGDLYLAVFPGHDGKIVRLAPKHPLRCP